MTKLEVLVSYRDIVIEIETLERQSEFLNRYIGGPRPLRGVALTGMPRGTNDPDAAMIQRNDGDDTIYRLEEKVKELRDLVDTVEHILDAIDDRRNRNILRNYYCLGMTDEKIAELLGVSTSRVNELRKECISNL